MRTRSPSLLRSAATVFLVLLACLGTRPAHGCNVPVFRYALERWPAGTAELVIFHRGSLPAAEDQRLDTFRRMAERTSANVSVAPVDLAAAPAPERLKLWSLQTNPPLPWVLLRLADSADAEPPVWTGPLEELPGQGLVSSPARNELGQRLLQGDAVVWVLIESGDANQDELAATLLTNELRKLEGTLKLPPVAADDPAPLSALPLRIAFSVQRVARTAAEELFIRMMLHGEAVDGSKPVVVPVFGRGRALTALSGAEISPGILRQAATFLCGACSCEVKEMNPGKDLVMAVRWDSIFSSPEAASLAARPGPKAGERVAIAPGLPENQVQTPVPIHPSRANPRRGLKLLASTGLAFIAIVILLVGIVLLRSLRQK